MDRIIAPKCAKIGIFRCLKAGVSPEFPNQGTPQGGVCSPLLANIVLNGIEDVMPSNHGRITRWNNSRARVRGVNAVRYADDMVFILKDTKNKVHNDLQGFQLKSALARFLKERGMELSPEKTKLTKSTDGFDFLGWNFKVQGNGKLRCIPSKENYKNLIKKIKPIINSSNVGSQGKAKRLAPIIRGWRNYHKYCEMRSPYSLWFTRDRAFKVFNKERHNNFEKTEKLIQEAFPKVSYKQHGHQMVKGNRSPFDGDLAYWSRRKSKLYDGYTAKMLQRQSHKCGHCGLSFLPGEKIHLHHKDGNHSNWKYSNLTAVHRSCHQYIHMKGTTKVENI